MWNHSSPTREGTRIPCSGNKDWCWSWSSWCEELTHWKRPWCWETLRAEREGGNRGWDGWTASQTQWTWVWANSGRWWRMGKPGMLLSMGSQRVRQASATEQQQIFRLHWLGWEFSQWMDMEFCQVFFLYWDDGVIFILPFANVVCRISWFVHIEASLHPENKSHLITVYDTFHILLNFVY